MKKSSKNNISEISKHCHDTQLRYGLRKLASGALVSAVIGGFIMVGSNVSAHASIDVPNTDATNLITAAKTPDPTSSSEAPSSSSQLDSSSAASTNTPAATDQSQNKAATANSGNSSAAPAKDMLTGTIKIIDDDEGKKVLQSYTIQGKAGTTIYDEQALHFAYPNPDPKLNPSWMYDPLPENFPIYYQITENGQVWEIHLTHRIYEHAFTEDVYTRLRIMYKYGEDAYNKAGQAAAPDYWGSKSKVLHFRMTKDQDGVTSKYLNRQFEVVDGDFSWIPESPIIEGYTADKPTIPASDLVIPKDIPDSELHNNPNNPKAYIEVVVTYSPNPQKAKIIYVDDDANNAVLHEDTINGTTGSVSDYRTKDTINHYLQQNYVLDKDDTQAGVITFDNKDDIDQVFYVYLKHATSSFSKTVTNTVHYVMSDGSQAPADHVQTIVFHASKDAITGTITWDSQSQAFDAVTVPTVPGYTPDQTIVSGATVNPFSSNIVTTVTYNKDVTPSKPDTPNPPTDPKQDPSTTPSTPSTNPTTPSANPSTPSTKAATKPSIPTTLTPSASPAKQALPQTGNQEKQATGVFGLALAMIGILLGSGYKRKQN